MGEHEIERRGFTPDTVVAWIGKLFPNASGDRIVALVRTVVPVFIATLITAGVTRFPDVAAWLDNTFPGDWRAAVGAFAVTLVTGLYYSFARWVEARWPLAGAWLLGSSKTPVYVPPAK